MSENPGITFIIAAYNLGDSLVRCVRSIQVQTLEQFEILIVNDKSTDNTLNIATQLCLTDPNKRTRCISHLRNFGLPSVRNTGLMAARMKYVWHIDGDDFLPGKNVALHLYRSLEELGLLAIKFPVMRLTEDAHFCSDSYAKSLSDYACEVVAPQVIDKQYGFAGAFSIVYSKKFALTLNLFNLEGVNIGEDQILNAQLLKSLPCIGLVNIPMYAYDKTGGSMMRESWNLEKYLEERLHIHFIARLFRNQLWRLSPFARQRLQYLWKKLFTKAESDLANKEFSLLTSCWSSDIHLLRSYSGFSNHPNPKVQKFFENSLIWTRSQDFSHLFDLIFSETEFVIHCGAHKTATTYMQACLNNNRYQLAMNGIIYIDYYQFRRQILTGLQDNSLDLKAIRSKLVELSLPLLFRLPKRVIIFDENLVPPSQGFWVHQKLEDTFACFKGGYNLRLLHQLLSALANIRVSVSYCIRDFRDYIPSRYCEQIKWNHFCEFEKYIGSMFSKRTDISWEFVCRELSDLCESFSLNAPVILSFEAIRDDIPSFLKFLTDCPADAIFNRSKYFDFPFSDSFTRPSPTSEAIDLAFQASHQTNHKFAQKLYKKLVSEGYGSSKYTPLSSEKYSEICTYLDQVYESNIASLITCMPKVKRNDLGSAYVHYSFETLSDYVSPYERYLSCLADNPSDDFNQQSRNSLWQRLECVDVYENAEDCQGFNFTRMHFGIKRKKGISAMLRVKNEELNIESVLFSCLRVFDEIVIVDNNSDDKTLSVIASVRDSQPSYADKIRVFTYPFDIARCGQENYECPENSVHSLAFFYNYCLSLCEFSHVFKWDGDMILPDHMIGAFQAFKNRLFKKDVLCTPCSTVFGAPLGITVFRGHNGKCYFKESELESEPRLFENRSDVRFVKDILWERLFSPHLVKIIRSDQPLFVELKDVGQDEFSHWKIGGLGMGPRKRRELINFMQISQLTSQATNPSEEDLGRLGFREYLDPLD